MNPLVLILSSVYDFSVDLVTLRLKERGVPYLRINKEHAHEYRFSLSPTIPLLTVGHQSKLDKVVWSIETSIKSIWFRQPVFLRNTPSSPLTIDDQLARSQWAAFYRALSVFEHAAWMNWPQATYLAESKPYQLLTAHVCGFKVPKTVVGNNVSNETNDQAIIKSLDTVLLREGNDCLFTYSTISDMPSDEESASVPFIIQEYITNKVDIRVTVIGDRLSAVRILSNDIPIAGDWRTIAKETLHYEDINLPEPITSACIALTRKLGLQFAAIDLLEREDDYYFLEVNPTGEWGWLNSDERRFDTLIADWLANPPEQSNLNIR